MKKSLFLSFWVIWGAFVAQKALAETYQVIDDKAYKVVEVEGTPLISNEWLPLTSDQYSDGYDLSEKAKVIKDANESLRRIKEGAK